MLDEKITGNTRVCSKHFTADAFTKTIIGLTRLKQGTVPTEFNWTTASHCRQAPNRSSKLDGMLGKLQKDVDDAGSSADSPAGKDQSLEEASSPGTSTAKEKENRGGSSRRKPKVTRKVVESEGEDEETSTLYARIQEMLDGDFLEDDADDDTPPPPPGGADESNNDQSTSLAMSPACDSPQPSTSMEMEVDTDVLRVVDMESDEFIIPEGTVVVQPEAVLESEHIYNGPEFKHNKKTNKVSCDLSNVICSACNKKINPNMPGSAKRHPVLKVLLCKRCYTWYTSDEIDQDAEGMDEQCRWCGDGGNLICCDFCNNAFCKACIKRNLGRTELSNLLDAGDNVKWNCYVCDPKPLAPLIDEATTILAAIDELERKEKARQMAKKDNKMKPKTIVITPQQHQQPQPKQAFMTIQQQQQQQRMLQQQRMAAAKTVPGRGVVQPVNSPGGSRTVQWDIPINEFNCGNILDRMLASTQSMNSVLTSMREDLRSIAKHGGVSEQFVRREIGNKLRRAMVAFKKSFDDITLSAHSSMRARAQQGRSGASNQAPQQVRPVGLVKHGAPVNQNQPKMILMRMADGKLVRMPMDAVKNTSLRQAARSGVITDQRKPVPSKQSSDVVVILSDSSDDETGPTVAKRAEATPVKDTSSANHSEVESETGKSGSKRKSFQLRVSLDKGCTPESKRRRMASGDDGRKKKDAETSDDGTPLSERLEKEAEEAKVKSVHDREARRLLRQARREKEREEPEDDPVASFDIGEDDPKKSDRPAEKDSGMDHDGDDNGKSSADEETGSSDKKSARKKSETKKRDAKSDGNESDGDDKIKSSADEETGSSDKTAARNKSKTKKRDTKSKSDHNDDDDDHSISSADEETARSDKTSARNKSKTKKRDAKSKADRIESDGDDNNKSSDEETDRSVKTSARNKSKTKKHDAKSKQDDSDDNSKSSADEETVSSDKKSARNKSKTKKRHANSKSHESDGDDNSKSSDEETTSSDKTSARNKLKAKKRDAKSKSDDNDDDDHGKSSADEEITRSDKTSARNKSKTKKHDAKSKPDGNESDGDDNSKSSVDDVDKETTKSDKTSDRNKSKTKKRDTKSKPDESDGDDNSKSSADEETTSSDKTSARNMKKTKKRHAKSKSDESDGDDNSKSSADEETVSSDKTSARKKSKTKKRDAKSKSDGNISDNDSHLKSGSDNDSPSKPKDDNDSPSKPSSDIDTPSKPSGGKDAPAKSDDENVSPHNISDDNDSLTKSSSGNKSPTKSNSGDDHSEMDADASLTNGLLSEKNTNKEKSTSRNHDHNGDGDTKSDDDDIEISDGDLLDSDGADDPMDVIDISDTSPVKDAFRGMSKLNGKSDDSPNRTDRGDTPKVVQVDGAPDRRDTSNTSDSSGAGIKHETSEDLFGSLSFEPLFEIQPMNSDDSNAEAESETPVKRKGKAVKRSRADIEAQRVLHKELLEDSGSQSDAVDATSDSDDDVTGTDNIASAASSGDVYDPYKTKDKTDKHRYKCDSTHGNKGSQRKLKQRERSSRRRQHHSRNSSGDESETEAKTSKHRKHKSRRDKRSNDDSDDMSKSKRKDERKSSKKSREHSDSDDFEVVTRKSRFSREKDSRKTRGGKVKREDSESETRHRKGKKDSSSKDSSSKDRRGDGSKVKSESVHRKGKRDSSSDSDSESRSRRKKDSRKYRRRSEEESDEEAKDRGKSRKGRRGVDDIKGKKRGRHSKDSEESSNDEGSDKVTKDRGRLRKGRKEVDDNKEKQRGRDSKDSEESSKEEESDDKKTNGDRETSKKGRQGVHDRKEKARRGKDSGESSNEEESDKKTKNDREQSRKSRKGIDDKKEKRRGRHGKDSEESSNDNNLDQDDRGKSKKGRKGEDDKKEKAGRTKDSEESSDEASTSKKNGESRKEKSPDLSSPSKSIADPSSATKSRRLSKIGVKSTPRKNIHTSDDSSNDDCTSRKHSKSRKSSDSEDVEDLLRRKTRRRRDRKKKADSEDDNVHAKSLKQKDGKKSSKTDKKSRRHSESDSELEKDIDRLSKMPMLSSRRREETDSDDNDGEGSGRKKLSYQEMKKKRAEAKFKVKESKSKKGRYDDLDSDGEEEEEVDEQDEVDEAMDKDSDDDDDNGPVLPMSDDDPDDRARKALFADDSGDDDDDNDDNDDDDTDIDESSKASKRKSSKQKKEMEAENEDDEASASDESEGTRKARRNKSSKLLDAKLSDTDDDSDMKQKSKKKTKKGGGRKKKVVGSSSDDDDKPTTDQSSDDTSSSEDKKKKKRKRGRGKRSDSSDDSDSSGKKKKGKKKRSRIKKMESSNSDKSGSGGNDSDDANPASAKRRKIRKILKDKKLSDQTVAATKAESDRRKRIKERQEMYNEVTVEDTNSPTKCPKTTKLVLEMDPETKKPIIQVLPALICLLKPHQVQAVKFLWDCCAESLDLLKKDEGSGCILAHCMGLGKTLSVITFLHTLMSYGELTGVRTAIIVCPLNTVLNWENEWGKWLTEDEQFDVYEMSSVKNNEMRAQVLKDWQKDGGILIIGYEMYRNLTQHRNMRNKRLKKTFTETLVDPGPNFVVCDEGHILKNESTAVSKALNAVKTRRRVVLTGTPLQNNLIEYHCMVNFVKPNLLGSKKEFCNRFVNPITNGQCANSTDRDVKIMKRRAHVLHESLAGCVQRKDYSALTKFLMPKHEYVLSIRLSKVQIQLYEKYLDLGSNDGRRMKLFADYQALMRIWTHPWVLRLAEIRQQNQATYDTDDSFIESRSENSIESESERSDSDDDVQVIEDKKDSGSGSDKVKSGSDHEEVVSRWKTRSRSGLGKKPGDASPDPKSEDEMVTSEWWASYVNKDSQFDMNLGGKLVLLAQILKMSESIGDKVLVFSQSLLSLNLIEDFLDRWDTDSAGKSGGEAGMQGWTLGADYFRMDGSSSAQQRHSCAAEFNAEDNVRARLFLISTKAGSLGTNLIGANRVIIFDASWNPSHDVQSIFRVYRFGQLKPVYVYRFLAQGTMEEKIYERQVTKQSLAQRVVDEHQIERHFNMADLQELYNFTPDRLDDPNRTERPIPKLPKDRLLAELLVSEKDWIVQYHEHDSLLENKLEEELTEEERKAAWDEFENDKLEVRQQPHPRMAPMYAGYPDQSQLGPPGGEMMPQAESIARAIYAANPQLTMAELQSRTVQYLSAMNQQRQQYQRQQEYMREMRRLQQRQQENEQLMAAAQRMTGAGTWPHNATPEQMMAASQRPRNPAQTSSLEDMLTRKK